MSNNATLPNPFAIAAPPMIGSLPATIVCYILYGLGAFLPIVFIVIVAIFLGCRRRLRKSKFVGTPDIGGDQLPEVRKTEIRHHDPSLRSHILHPATMQLPVTVPLSLDATLSADNPNVYFRQHSMKTIHVQSAANELLGNDPGELASGSTASGRLSGRSSASRSTLQIRRQSDHYSTGSVNDGFADGEDEACRRKNKSGSAYGDVMLKPDVVNAWTEDMPTDSAGLTTTAFGEFTNNGLMGIERSYEERLHQDHQEQEQEQALRYFDEVNDDLEQDLDVSALSRPTTASLDDVTSPRTTVDIPVNINFGSIPVDIVTHL